MVVRSIPPAPQLYACIRKAEAAGRAGRRLSPAQRSAAKLGVGRPEDPRELGRLVLFERLGPIVAPQLLRPLARHLDRVAHAAVGGEPGWAEFIYVPVLATYVTYAFLHGDLLHLFFNMFALYMFGPGL
mgnify:CR=1 FL=1